MSSVTDAQIASYVQANIGNFHDRRLESLNNLKLNNLLRRKNPYLFRSKNLVAVSDLIKSLLDAHLSSQEETLFGNWFPTTRISTPELSNLWGMTPSGETTDSPKITGRSSIG